MRVRSAQEERQVLYAIQLCGDANFDDVHAALAALTL